MNTSPIHCWRAVSLPRLGYRRAAVIPRTGAPQDKADGLLWGLYPLQGPVDGVRQAHYLLRGLISLLGRCIMLLHLTCCFFQQVCV